VYFLEMALLMIFQILLSKNIVKMLHFILSKLKMLKISPGAFHKVRLRFCEGL
jgi:hypothetical protein